MSRRNHLLLVGALVLLAGCSRPASHAFSTQTPTTQVEVPAGTAVEEPVTITGAGFDLHTAGTVSSEAFHGAWAGVLDTLNRYLEAAVLGPLRSGGPAGDLAPFFTPLAVGRVVVAGPDRSAFIDEGLAPATYLRAESSVATLTALAGADGAMSVVVADLDLRITGWIGDSPLEVARTGELVLMPEGGTWQIDAWELSVTRTVSDVSTTVTTRS